jgi:hypothetical protein
VAAVEGPNTSDSEGDTPTMTDTDAKQVERWIYAGVRHSSKGKYHLWIDPAGEEELTFAKFPARLVGGIYEVRVDRKEDGSFGGVYITTASWTGDRSEDGRVGQWQTEDPARRGPGSPRPSSPASGLRRSPRPRATLSRRRAGR